MSSASTYGGTSANQCAYCGNWHTYSEEMCRDITKYEHSCPPQPLSLPPTDYEIIRKIHEDGIRADEHKRCQRSAVERERAAFIAGHRYDSEVDIGGTHNAEAESIRRYPLPKEETI